MSDDDALREEVSDEPRPTKARCSLGHRYDQVGYTITWVRGRPYFQCKVCSERYARTAQRRKRTK